MSSHKVGVIMDEGDLIRVTEGVSDTVFELCSVDSERVIGELIGRGRKEWCVDEFVEWIEEADAVKVRRGRP